MPAKIPTVIVEVRNGTTTVVQCPKGVRVIVNDRDNDAGDPATGKRKSQNGVSYVETIYDGY